MNDITTELHVRSTNGQGKIMPNTKQTEENNTIKQIECTICSRSTSIEYVSIVKIVNIFYIHLLGNHRKENVCSFTISIDK